MTCNPKSNRKATELKTSPHSSTLKPQPCPREQKVSVHEKRVQSLCECVKELVLRLIPDSSLGQLACTVLIRKLGRVHPRTSVP